MSLENLNAADLVRRSAAWMLIAATAALLACGQRSTEPTGVESAAADTANAPGAPRVAVPKARCRPGDRPEPGLQGRGDGSDPDGYQCNLDRVGELRSTAWATLDVYKDCAYYGLLGYAARGTNVIDISNPASPTATAQLVTPAMADPWESLRANNARGLLAADSALNTFLDLYDISGDCRSPRLLSSTNMAPATGHEGWFSPDGMTYYMSGSSSLSILLPQALSAIDVSDPAKPRILGSWSFGNGSTHGGSTSADGSRSYVCRQNVPPHDALLILDTSEVAQRKPDPQVRLITEIPLSDNQWCQGAYAVTYGGHPYLIQYGEHSGIRDCNQNPDHWATFGYPRIYDLADERKPVLVSSMLLEVHLPEHCSEVIGEGAANGLGYSVHHCTPDRLHDPTILACGWFKAGLRVMDIRDPRHPRELAYYNPGNGALAAAAGWSNGFIGGTGSRPVIRAERREIVFTNDATGLVIVRFAEGVWPFPGSAPCPEAPDWLYTQYNPDSPCVTAHALK